MAGSGNYTNSPAPDTSADWGYDDHGSHDVGGSGIVPCSEPADPMHFLPNSADPIYGSSPDPVPGEVDAPWGYPGHGMTLTNP